MAIWARTLGPAKLRVVGSQRTDNQGCALALFGDGNAHGKAEVRQLDHPCPRTQGNRKIPSSCTDAGARPCPRLMGRLSPALEVIPSAHAYRLSLAALHSRGAAYCGRSFERTAAIRRARVGTPAGGSRTGSAARHVEGYHQRWVGVLPETGRMKSESLRRLPTRSKPTR
jgi:hypothetical protein